MTDEFAKTVNRIISDMYQAISNVNTTVLLIDSSGTINCIWRNLSSRNSTCLMPRWERRFLNVNRRAGF